MSTGGIIEIVCFYYEISSHLDFSFIDAHDAYPCTRHYPVDTASVNFLTNAFPCSSISPK